MLEKIKVQLQPKQKKFREAVDKYPVVFYGGAKGGGKSYALRNILLILLSEIPNTKGLLIRKTYDELVSNHINQFFRENPVLEQYYNRGDKVLKLPNKSTLNFRHLQYASDVYNYQGQEFDYIGIDEITQHQKEIFTILRSSNRTTNPKVKPRFLLTGNPGGVGHAWVKSVFINRQFEPNEKPEDYYFVPAKVYDNAELIDNDPAYLERLNALPDHLRRAYLEGDWDIFAGQYFTEFRRDKHVIEPFAIPDTWKRYRSIDFGRTAPYCCKWYAINYDGYVFVYREYYQAGLDADENIENIKRLSQGEHYGYTVGDASMFSKTGHGETLAQIHHRKGIMIIPSSKDRIAGWNVMHQYLRWDKDTEPMIKYFNTCVNSIRTIPELIHDEHKPEDLDTTGEDHSADTDRYFLQTLRERKTKAPLNHTQKLIADLKAKMGISGDYNPEFYE